MSMRTITIQYRARATNYAGFDVGGTTQEWGTNSRDGGVFRRKADGSWQQEAGNTQTPLFRSPAHLRQWLRVNRGIRDARITGQQGW